MVDTAPIGQTAARVAVSLVLWRTDLRQLDACLASLASQTLSIQAVGIQINEGSDDLAAVLRQRCDDQGFRQCHVESSADNLGYASGHNRMLDHLFGEDQRPIDAVIVVNPDVIAAPELVAELARFARDFDRPVLAGPVLELADPASFTGEDRIDTCGIVWDRWGRHYDALQGRPLGESPVRARRMAGVSGACMYISRSAYDRVKSTTAEFFDGDFIAYREDAELGVRADLVGVESWLVPSAQGRHVRALRGTERGTSDWVDYLGVRNRFLMRFKLGSNRPGGVIERNLRDAIVILGVVVRERSSIPAIRDAWRLRRAMVAKRRLLKRLTAP